MKMELTDTEKKVLDAMKSTDEPLKTKEIASIAKIDEKESAKVIKKLKDKGLVESPKRCYYRPVKNKEEMKWEQKEEKWLERERMRL